MVNKITNRSAINFLDVICSCPKPKQKPKNKHYSFLKFEYLSMSLYTAALHFKKINVV